LTDADSAATAAVGRVAGAFGLHGELKVVTGDPADITPGLRVRARLPGGTERALLVTSVRAHKNQLLLRVDGVADADQADALRGAVLLALVADLRPLPAGTYRDGDLIGLRVTDARLGPLGDVSGVLHYPHADMLVVGPKQLLVPMLAAYGIRIDRDAGTISSELPLGFEDL
jgi:16S rRNA processing protein RimM